MAITVLHAGTPSASLYSQTAGNGFLPTKPKDGHILTDVVVVTPANIGTLKG